MPEDRWQTLMEVNLLAPERITSALSVLNDDGRIVCVSSLSAIAGNAGQTNYATSKAGLLDLVERPGARARDHDQRGRAGVHRDADDRGDADRRARGGAADELAAPGRAAGRRRRDGRVARRRRAAWIATSIRVCGQSLLGADADDAASRAAGPRLDDARATSLERDGRRRPRSRWRSTRTCAASRCATSSRRPTRTCSRSALHMELLAQAPFSAVGVVHIANRITQHRPLRLGEELALRVAVSELRPHRRGRAFDFAHRRCASATSSCGRARRRTSSAARATTTRRATPGRSRTSAVTAEWRLPDDLGRRYAAVSGDHNPIHLHALERRSRSASRARSPTGCGRRRAAWPRCGCRTRSPPRCASRSRSCCPAKVTFGEAEDRFAVHGHLEGVLSA